MLVAWKRMNAGRPYDCHRFRRMWGAKMEMKSQSTFPTFFINSTWSAKHEKYKIALHINIIQG